MVYAWLVNLLSAACPFCRISSTEAAERAPVILVPGRRVERRFYLVLNRTCREACIGIGCKAQVRSAVSGADWDDIAKSA